MAEQVKAWEGEFGEAYTKRNVIDWRTRVPAFRHMLQGLGVNRVLEVGCNRGHNLVAISEILARDAEVIGVEPNLRALRIARQSSDRIGVLHGSAYDLPFKDGYFDLVFTAGVLIHVALGDLPAAIKEIHRVSHRYILAIECFAEQETIVTYRGRDDLFWKRNFLMHYQAQCPDLKVVRTGDWGPRDGFDIIRWWLLENRAQAGLNRV